MENKTKQSALLEYIKDLEHTFGKIKNNTAKPQDYILLEEYYIMVGISKNYIDNIYIDCGFENSNDFYTQRQKSFHHQEGNVSCTLSKIGGTTEAILEALQYQLAKMNALSA